MASVLKVVRYLKSWGCRELPCIDIYTGSKMGDSTAREDVGERFGFPIFAYKTQSFPLSVQSPKI